MLNLSKLLTIPVVLAAAATPIVVNAQAQVTTTDSTLPEYSQEQPYREFGRHHRGKRNQNIDIQREETDTQIIMTITSDDEETLQKIQSDEEKHSQIFSEAIVSKEEISNGIILTLDKEKFEQIKSEKQIRHAGHQPHIECEKTTELNESEEEQ